MGNEVCDFVQSPSAGLQKKTGDYLAKVYQLLASSSDADANSLKLYYKCRLRDCLPKDDVSSIVTNSEKSRPHLCSICQSEPPLEIRVRRKGRKNKHSKLLIKRCATCNRKTTSSVEYFKSTNSKSSNSSKSNVKNTASKYTAKSKTTMKSTTANVAALQKLLKSKATQNRMKQTGLLNFLNQY